MENKKEKAEPKQVKPMQLLLHSFRAFNVKRQPCRLEFLAFQDAKWKHNLKIPSHIGKPTKYHPPLSTEFKKLTSKEILELSIRQMKEYDAAIDKCVKKKPTYFFNV